MQQTAVSPWEQEVIQTGFSQTMPFGWFETHAIGGDMGSAKEDFEVNEIPAYLPTGTGEHVYLWIEKKGRTTLDVLKVLEKAYNVKEADVGYAGKKDANAVTGQWFSVLSTKPPEDAVDIINNTHGLRVLTITRHTNKLRLGHLKGNHFGVNLYDVTASDKDIQLGCERLMTFGFINYFGLQRFGHHGDNVKQGLRILQGGQAHLQQKKMYISALQSAVFNLYAGRRFQQLGYAVVQGDVLQKIGKGCFVCDDPDTDNMRAIQGEVAVTGSLPGRKVMMGNGYSAELEAQCAHDLGIAWPEPFENCASLDALKGLAEGDRRQLWIRPQNIQFKHLDTPNAIHIDFDLPSGCYATVLLRHLCGRSFTR